MIIANTEQEKDELENLLDESYTEQFKIIKDHVHHTHSLRKPDCSLCEVWEKIGKLLGGLEEEVLKWDWEENNQ